MQYPLTVHIMISACPSVSYRTLWKRKELACNQPLEKPLSSPFLKIYLPLMHAIYLWATAFFNVRLLKIVSTQALIELMDFRELLFSVKELF